mmetsp:Transcript_20527/g.56669  ORF Transcript_20527/g.56669 Transcript_20527/m.56669 type:complete len:579 (-) Transcript_20527:88-1824(-)
MKGSNTRVVSGSRMRRRPTSLWTTTASTAALATLSISHVAAFQSIWPFAIDNQRNQHFAGFDPQPEFFGRASGTAVGLSTLVEYDVEKRQNIMSGFLKVSPMVESDVNIAQSVMAQSASPPPKDVTESAALEFGSSDELALVAPDSLDQQSPNRVQFKGLSTTSFKGRYRRKVNFAERRGRILSSTMPGFNSESDRQRAFREGIREAEKASGRKYTETPETRRKRKKNHGETMYKNSASVPDSLVQFADDIHAEERITRQEEIRLGELTQEAVRLQRVYETLKDDLEREPTDQEWCAASGKINMKAIEQAIEAGFEAKNKLVTSNLRMVQSVVNTYIRNGLSSQYNAGDMMQEGILALIRAAEKFEPDRGWKFSTYAMYWVRASVKRNQVYQSRTVPVPHRVFENHKRLIRVQKELESTLDRRPTKKELGEAVGMSEIQVERCFSAMQQKFYSLDQDIHNTYKPQNSGRKDKLVEIIQSRALDEELGLKSTFLREAFVETLHRHLNEQEVELIMLRYGLKHCPEHTRIGGQPTIAELSRTVGLKPDKVRRIINRALKQLKANPEEWIALEKDLYAEQM